jgi:formylmethanofuran dehydrogenase subunit E
MRGLAKTSLLFLVIVAVCPLGSYADSTSPTEEPALAQVAAVHGAAGPFAVAGYRMGQRALKEIGVARGSFDLNVVHKTPLEVQYSCIADGVQAATGVSVGKLNLRIEKATSRDMETIISDRRLNKVLVFRLTPYFLKNYLNLPENRLAAAGRAVLALPDDRIFTLEVSPSAPLVH